MSFPSPGVLFASLLFGAIGMGALVYARKMSVFKPAIIGVALMASSAVEVQWELPEALARRDQSHARSFSLNPGR